MPKTDEIRMNAKNSNIQSAFIADETAIILTKESSEVTIRSYFEGILKLTQSDNEYPINIDEVWMLAYSSKGNAMTALKKNFIEGIDFLLLQNKKQKQGSGGYNETDCMLTTSCLEYFIARKVRPVFEVYRQVFHKATKEVMFPESEIKQCLLMANEAVKQADKKVKRLEKDMMKEKAKTIAALEVKQQEQDLKNSCFFYLIKKGLYEEWQKFDLELKEARIYRQMEKQYKAAEPKQAELPF